MFKAIGVMVTALVAFAVVTTLLQAAPLLTLAAVGAVAVVAVVIARDMVK